MTSEVIAALPSSEEGACAMTAYAAAHLRAAGYPDELTVRA
jgi:hypothetical protein